MKILMTLEKETKNTVKYQAAAEFAAVETVYVNKRDLRAALGANKPWPHNIAVEVTWEEVK